MSVRYLPVLVDAFYFVNLFRFKAFINSCLACGNLSGGNLPSC